MVEIKPYRLSTVNESNNLTAKSKGKSPKSKNYKRKNTRTKSQGPDHKAENDFKRWCSDLEGYSFDLGPEASDKFDHKMKDMERHHGETYSNRCQPTIITNNQYTFTNPYIPKVILDTGVEQPKMDVDMNYLKKKSIGEAISQKLGKKDVYKTYMHKIYNLIVCQTNKHLQEKAA